jgi:hypothetical protein
MPRPKKKENQGLPSRWTLHHGAYYFQVPKGLESAWDGKRKFRLGDSLPEAYRVWGERVGRVDKIRTVGQLLEQYGREIVPTKAPSTQTQNVAAMKELLKEFSGAPLTSMTPPIIYGYLRKRTAKVSGKREIEVLSHALTKAVEWGYVEKHPFAWQMRIESDAPRTRYVEDWEIVECLSIDSKRKKGSILAVQSYIRVKLLTGMRRGDLLRLSMSEIRDDGIHLTPNKTKKSTGKRVIIGWSEERYGEECKAGDDRTIPVLQSRWRVLYRRDDRARRRMGVFVARLHGAGFERDQGNGAIHRARSPREVCQRRRNIGPRTGTDDAR